MSCAKSSRAPGIDGDIAATAEHIGRIAREMPLLAEQREGFITRIERHVDHLRTFGDEHTPRGIDFAAQLCFSQGTTKPLRRDRNNGS